ncbi:MAG TPA: bifunctional UDP-sugar hydrolase/5'-nucleotidase [Longimicrobium sp.]|jgi:2',3'-cyclic-nucleotide 2'-phosphodiesterase (5'-nucleotidase family)
MRANAVLPVPGRAAALLALCVAAACARAAPPAAPAPGEVKRVRIVHTSDVHGHLLPARPGWAAGREVGGAAVLAAHFDSAAARFAGPTLVLSSGDDLQGTVVSNLSFGRAAVAAHNAAGYDAAALGNHEFDWGQDTLRARIRESRFPWLAANLYAAAADTQPAWAKGWVMLERGGVRTAVVGIALPATPQVVLAGRVEGLSFGPAAPAAARAAREARAAGADFVVAVMHVGAECREPGSAPEEESAGCEGEVLEAAASLSGLVDLVLGGHTHKRVLTAAGGVPVSEPLNYGTAYGVTDLERRGGTTRVAYRAVRTPFADEVAPDTGVARVVAEWSERVRPLADRAVAGFAAAMENPDRGEYPLGNLLADAHRRATGAEASIVNNGSIRRAMPAGTVTWGMLYELQPFQNELVKLEVTGAQLREALEAGLDERGRVNAHVSGLVVDYDPAAPQGSRIREIRRDDGRVVGEADRVTLGLSEFVAGGGDRFTALTRSRPARTGVVDLDAVIAHLTALPQPVRPPGVGRWRAVR